MPSVEVNRRLWTKYPWRTGGEEWSANWGGTANLWHGTLMPRIGRFLGDVRALEIAPGYGRLTAYLKEYCSSLVLVDLAENCIESCRERFKTDTHLEYFVNDGQSLTFLPDQSIDFVVSFDSLVHADLVTIQAYLREIERVLVVGGTAVLHHSNLAAVVDEAPPGSSSHLRADDVSAELVAAAAAETKNLHCRIQELISWDDSNRLIDCISTFVHRPTQGDRQTERFINREFFARAKELRDLSKRYDFVPDGSVQ